MGPWWLPRSLMTQFKLQGDRRTRLLGSKFYQIKSAGRIKFHLWPKQLQPGTEAGTGLDPVSHRGERRAE